MDTYDRDWGQECAPYERDYRQEDKDNRAQGFDREPEPPEEYEPTPLDLDEIERLLTKLPQMASLTHAKDELLAAISGLVVEVKSLRNQLAYWRGLEEDTVYASAHGGNQLPDDCSLWVHHRDGESADRAVEAADGQATAYMRTRTLHPWQELSAEAPF
ncbi:hypothetical protein ABT340_41330 [Streptosporangium sp. NPDC000239]|uniref:hypothetical protein n=1 Tax=Streptosporangium sp. NPDC000239 TaxID=3154248 RepID=UPI0033333EAB